MRGLWAITCFITAGLIPASALAQTALPASTAEARSTSNASGPQLGPDEQLYPFADGKCAAIDRRSSSLDLAQSYRTFKWLGACRFGVADGKGYRDTPTQYIPDTFHRGVIIHDFLTSKDYSFVVNDSYLPGQVRTVILIKQKSKTSDLDYGNGLSFNKFYDASPRHTEDEFLTGEFGCPGLVLFNSRSQDRRYEGEVRKLCSKYRAGSDGKPPARYVLHYRYEYDGVTGHHVPSTPEHPNPAVIEIAICSYPPGPAQCRAAFAKLLAPFRERIDQVVSGDTAAQAAAIAALDARYAPLEAAEAARHRAIAVRIASQAPTYSAPRAPQVRAVTHTRSPSKARAATHARKAHP